MSTFYLLPPRAVVGDRLGDFLTSLLPGLAWGLEARAGLAEALLDALQEQANLHVVWRDDLPAETAPEQALADGFGAEPGDEVIEVRPAARAGEFTSRRWRQITR